MTINNHKNSHDRLFINYQYQSIVIDCYQLSRTCLKHEMTNWQNSTLVRVNSAQVGLNIIVLNNSKVSFYRYTHPTLNLHHTAISSFEHWVVVQFFWSIHREHTILLSRERVNKGTKRMNSLHLSPHLISSILRDFTGKTTAYKSCLTL